jgi:hypothetical protein
MHRFGNFRLASLTFFALSFMACDGGNGPGEPAPAVVGKWTGRYEAKEYGITVNVVMRIDADHTYEGHAMPNVAGLDSVHVYEETGDWTIVGNSFIAAKLKCRIVNPSDMVLRDTACPPSDTAIVNVVGDSLWTGKLRGEPISLTRMK